MRNFYIYIFNRTQAPTNNPTSEPTHEPTQPTPPQPTGEPAPTQVTPIEPTTEPIPTNPTNEPSNLTSTRSEALNQRYNQLLHHTILLVRFQINYILLKNNDRFFYYLIYS